MASEIQLSITFGVTKGRLSYDRSASPDIDLSGAAQYAGGAPTIPTTAALMEVGDVATLGLLYGKNLDGPGGGTISIGVKVSGTFYPTHNWKPGEVYVVRLVPGATYWWKASAGTPAFDYALFND